MASHPSSSSPAPLRSCWRLSLRPFFIVALVLLAFRSSVLDWNVVPTGSMRPTIVEGDYILVDRLAYDVRVPFVGWRIATRSEPRRGDIVIFEPPGERDRYVKRILGLPGDRLEIRDHRVLVNGQPTGYDFTPSIGPLAPSLRTRPIRGPRAHAALGEGGATERHGPVVVPLDHFFVLGDNRANSKDSRMFGFVPRQRLVGRATRVLVSLDPRASWTPRLDRLFQALA